MKREIIDQIVFYARRSYERFHMGGTGGNFSARLDNQTMVITASGVSLGDTNPDNLATVEIVGYNWQPTGPYVPSKEFHFHADIYRLRPEVGAILHSHPPFATAFAVKSRRIPMLTDAAFKQPPIPLVPFAASGSKELQIYMEQAIKSHPECKALLMEKHGICALGADVTAAYNMADLIEELARIAHLTEKL